MGAALLWLENPSWKQAAIIGVTVWAFARFYYFAFYVLHHYADPEYNYAGLMDLCGYLLRGKRRQK